MSTPTDSKTYTVVLSGKFAVQCNVLSNAGPEEALAHVQQQFEQFMERKQVGIIFEKTSVALAP